MTSKKKANSDMLTVKEVAHLLHIHVNTVRRWSTQGILKAYRLGPRGDRRFRREDIIALLQSNHEDTASPQSDPVAAFKGVQNSSDTCGFKP